jgi:hypothetical protein
LGYGSADAALARSRVESHRFFTRGPGVRCEILWLKGPDIPTESAVVQNLRRFLLAIIVLVMIGTAADLLLLEHYENGWQIAPLALIVAGLTTAAGCVWNGRPGVLLAWRIVMVLFIAAGLLGIVLHYLGNVEFQKEIDPTQGGWTLFVKAVTAKAPPALAPAVMVQTGLLGLLYTYSHPALSRDAALDRRDAPGAHV